MNRTRKLSRIIESTTIDSAGNEMIRYRSTAFKHSAEDIYAKLYLTFNEKIITSNLKFFYILIGYCDYSNIVNLNASIKHKMKENIKYNSLGSINNVISDLHHCGMIRRISSSQYMINPYIAARGSWPSVQKMRITWDDMSNVN